MMQKGIWAPLSVAAISLVAHGCGLKGNDSYSSGGAPQKIAQSQAKVERRNITGFRLLAGSLYMPPEATADVRVGLSAPVDRVAASPGKFVHKGELLVRLSTPNSPSDIQSARQALQAAQAAYTDAEVKYSEPVRAAQQQLQQAEDSERQARQQNSSDSDGSSVQEADDARKQAQQALEQARADEKTNLLQYRLQLEQAQNALSNIRSSVHEGNIVAPITGTVLSLNVQPGQQLGTSPNQLIGTVANLDALSIKSILTDDQLKAVHPGTPVEILFADVPDRIFYGRVAQIRAMPGGNGATLHEATISFGNTDHLVKPSSSLERVGIRLGSVQSVPAVPVGAIQRGSPGQLFVNKQVNGAWRAVPVTLGMSDGQYTEVRSGLSEGDVVQVVR
jgi:HlyD family secretion protein